MLKNKFQGKSMVFIRTNQRCKEIFVFKLLISNLIMLYNHIAIMLLFQVILFWGKEIQANKTRLILPSVIKLGKVLSIFL